MLSWYDLYRSNKYFDIFIDRPTKDTYVSFVSLLKKLVVSDQLIGRELGRWMGATFSLIFTFCDCLIISIVLESTSSRNKL